MADETAIEDDIIIRSKRVMFGGATGFEDWVEENVDWSTATGVMTIAANQGGTALLTLTNASPGSQGLSFIYDTAYPNGDGTVAATRIRPQIDETTLEGLAGFPAAPAPYELVYDLLVTPSGEPQRVYAWGTLTIYHGVGD